MNRADRSFLRHLSLAANDRVVDLSFWQDEIAAAVADAVPDGSLTLLTHDARLAAKAHVALGAWTDRNVHVLTAADSSVLPDARFTAAYLITRPYLSTAESLDLLRGARRCLVPNGRLLLYAATRHGASTLLSHAADVFGSIEVLDKPGGMRIARCIRDTAVAVDASGPPSTTDAPFMTHIRDHSFTFVGGSGTFSRDELDEGTELLLETVTIERTDRIADVGCGYGAVGIVAAYRAPVGHVTMLDVDARAIALARANARRNGVANVEVVLSDGFSAVDDQRFDLILSNPPLHGPKQTLRRLITEARDHLAPGGRLALVVHKAYDVRPLFARDFGSVEILADTDAFRVVGAIR